MKFPKIFGKKKDDDEDDFDEDDFDIAEIEEHDFDDELEEAMGSSRAREEAALIEEDEIDDAGEHDDSAGETMDAGGDSGILDDDDGDEEEMVGGDVELENPFDDVDDDDFDDDEYDDEEEASDKKKAIIFAAVGFGVLLISILGGAGWWFFSDSGSAPPEAAIQEKSSPNSVAMAMPAAPGSLNAGGTGGGGLNSAADVQPAPETSSAPPAEGSGDAAGNPEGGTESGTAFTPNAAEPASASSLNSLNTLNSLGGSESAGGGLVIPAVASAAMAKIADQPTAADQSQALSGAPVRGMLEEKDGIGELPKIASNGSTPWQVYARPSDPGISAPKIALIIEGIGLSRQASLGAINKLPPEIGMAISPYGRDLNDWVFRSRLAGHEVYMLLPMESDDFPLEDAGPLALDTRIQLVENEKRLDMVMASAGGYVGLMTFMGSRFMKAETQMRQLFKVFNERGVMFVVGGRRSRNDAVPIAKELKLVHQESEMYIDETPRIQQIRTNLDNLESLARDRGSILAVARPYPVTIKSILDWYETIEDKGIALVPASAIAVVPSDE
ncbi:MAG: divergent polysaccharide deacetylase family protein [Rhodospirillales bacterium]|nr:divergent polysaccharide deacetylase family protein [Rhodospirillales bacterium]MBO6785578.1 divergent polysaccharide deacetylase family protein [Rhodospirillales bacterium]